MSADLDIMVFRNVSELIKYLDDRIGEIERKLEDLSRMLEAVKDRKSKYERIKKLVEEISGETSATLSTTVYISGLRLVIDPKPVDEYEVLESVYRALSDKLNVLKRIRDIVETYLCKYLNEEGLNVIVELRADIPVRIMLKM
ncbi:MAG: hypothetical protein GXO23_02985 [Crenarchaeota archaeon]|nr:hypothetical protein [Thermoproteota archaeon]